MGEAGPGPPIAPGGGPFADDGAARAASLPPPLLLVLLLLVLLPVAGGGGEFMAAYGGRGYGGYAYGIDTGLVIIMLVDAACINGGRIVNGAGLVFALAGNGVGVVVPAANVASTVATGNAAVDDGVVPL